MGYTVHEIAESDKTKRLTHAHNCLKEFRQEQHTRERAITRSNFCLLGWLFVFAFFIYIR